MDRRALLTGAVAAFLAAAAPAPASLVELSLPGRRSRVTVWAPAAGVKGVVLFGHGYGSWPDRYVALASRLVAAGFVVLAPLHVDSLHHPDRATFDRRTGFLARLADMRAASAHAAARWPGLPVAAAGHSFGSLIALCQGGALASLGPLRDLSVKAALCFSTPGKVPGLVAPDAYARLATPTLVITGDADLVPGFVTDWRDHLFPVESAPAGGKSALIVAGATHELAGGQPAAAFASASAHAIDFLKAFLLADAAAAKALAAAPATAAERWLRR